MSINEDEDEDEEQHLDSLLQNLFITTDEISKLSTSSSQNPFVAQIPLKGQCDCDTLPAASSLLPVPSALLSSLRSDLLNIENGCSQMFQVKSRSGRNRPTEKNTTDESDKKDSQNRQEQKDEEMMMVMSWHDVKEMITDQLLRLKKEQNSY